MSEVTLLESRVDKIERDNRRLKLTLGALLLALAAVPLIGAVMPQQIPGMALGSLLLLVAAVPLVGAVISDGTPGVIEAREFRVVDKNGTPRASVSDDGIHVRDENGTIRAVMEAEGIGYYDETRDERAVMDIGGIRCGNRKGNSRTEMDIHGIRCRDMEGNRADYAAYGIDMTDDDDTPRLTMTPNTLAISDEDSQLRAMIQTGGISYYDWNGELVWEVCQSIG